MKQARWISTWFRSSPSTPGSTVPTACAKISCSSSTTCTPASCASPAAASWKAAASPPATGGRQRSATGRAQDLINRWNDEFDTRPAPDYFQSFGLGFYEYFQLAEDIGARPLPILNCGMACQFNSSETAADRRAARVHPGRARPDRIRQRPRHHALGQAARHRWAIPRPFISP